jgi:iron complex transport system ATP-binding protein
MTSIRTTTAAALRIEGVSFAYAGGPAVLDGVSFSLAAGQLLGLVGPNGAGKSTLLAVAAGLLRPADGGVRLGERALREMGRLEVARRVAFLPQAVQPAFGFTVAEVVLQGRYPHLGPLGFEGDGDRRIAADALAAVEASAFAARPFEELSGGEQKRVLIASAIAQEAGVLLLDEPTAALDLHHQVAVYRLLRQLADAGKAVAVVTHDLNLAAQFCDRLLLLSGGRVAADGPPAEVVRRELLEPVYQQKLVIVENPATHTPVVLAVAE